MRNTAFKIAMVVLASLFLNGCGKSSRETELLNELKNYKQPPDTDVAKSPEYNFSSFSGALCKTKVKVALTEVLRYNGEHAVTLFPPDSFDPTDPNYRPVRNMQVITVLPVGTLLRIDRLMEDNGEWGGVRAGATLENGEYAKKNVYIDREFLAKNLFLWPGWTNSTNWAVEPGYLETVTNAP